MALNYKNYLVFMFFFVFLAKSATSSYISYGALEEDGIPETVGTSGRALLQAKTPCPEDFANKNYSEITTKCKGPNYPAEACCNAFKVFACPYLDLINADTNDCSNTMFSYINLYGRYPPGLFANMCKEGKEGLECPDDVQSSSADHHNFTYNAAFAVFVMLISALFMF